jgi:hypothetical protein
MKIRKHLSALTFTCVLGFAPAAFAQNGTVSQMPGMAPMNNAPAATSAPAAPAPAATPAPASGMTATGKGAPAATAEKPAGKLTAADKFKTEAEAAAHCPGDTVVWVSEGKTKVYHLSSSKLYGKTKHGAYACKAAADAAGYHQSKK